MNPALPDRREQTLVRLDELLTERLEQEQARLVKAFAGRYLFAMASDDLLETSLEDHYGSILGLWEWFSQRPAGAILMRAFNPTLDEHGWRSIHTIVDVLLDDRPFLVDSLSMELVRHGLTVHGINHPVMRVQRDPDGRMLGIGEGRAEALLRFEVDHQDGDTAGLLADLRGVLADVDAAVEDWRPMRDRVLAAVEELHHCELPIAAAERDEALDFLRWVANDHFTFIGSRIYDLVADEQGDVLRLVPGSGLGVLRVGEAGHESKGFAHVPAELRDRARLPEILVLTKSTARSSIHRPAHLDYIGVKRFGEHGEVIGEWRFLGLYSSTAYSMRPSDIPLLRVRRQHVLQGSGLEPNSHDGKALQHIIDTFPRDELFQCDEQELLRIATGIMRVEERHRLRIFLRRDPFARFVSVLVYVPRERYDTALRKRMQAILAEGLDGDASEFDVLFSDSVMARVHFIVQTPDGGVAEPDVAAIEERMAEAMLSWDDKLLAALLEQYGEAEGNRLYRRFSGSFPAAYRDDYRPRNAALDAHRLDSLNAGGLALAMQLYRPLESGAERLRFKVFGLDRPMALSDGLPMLERMGLTVIGARPYVINRDDGAECFWVLDFDLSADHGLVVDVAAMRDNFQEAFARVYAGDMENDGFNRLILAAGLDWRQVVLLRAVCKYLLQAGSPFSQSYMEDSLAINAAIARLLVSLFETRFDPRYQGEREAEVDTLVQQVEAALDQVANLDQDRILRRYLHTIRALLRSNYYQRASDGGPKPYLSLKLDPALVPDLPEPRPRYEIFVYSPWVEGVHLRGGKVARGGLRWSDRREDFRTEVLGLMKAQMVKNAVIVPVGAKGGFVPKRLPGGDRAAIQAEGIRCYKTFVSGLLDLTDNLVGGKPVAPADVLRYDEDDPYLVVAADKGTASFSDIANAISADYGFWLGDAFASGGAHGYDHKRMGITARGAWESVKRHFSELGTDIARDTFTVVGIGDMSGDVFGNGMLLSRRIKLVAAFNHLHIFLDPAPDPEAAFEERKRLFEQPGSSWSDYDPAFISKGGGVFARSAKSIPISAEVKALLAIDAARLTPAELIRAILQAPVDLLWNGGIGTYVKSSDERHAEVGDRTNDSLRVDAPQLRCKVIGEGGNLGFTQLARVEFARRGGLLNTDAVDNSAGVDCSDHEVNIKILLDRVVDAGDLTIKQRNQLLADMTVEVADLVLRHNYLQTQSISVSSINARQRFMEHIRLMRLLEREGRLVRALESLPDDEQLTERDTSGEGFTRPELAVLLAYAKIRLFDQLLAADAASDVSLRENLLSYFPAPLRERFGSRALTHPLAGEIIATVLTNEIANRMGANFCVHIEEETGEDAVDIARAYVAGREIFGLAGLWEHIEALDNRIAAAEQSLALAESRRLLARVTLWLLRNRRPPLDVAREIEFFKTGVAELRGQLGELLPEVLTQVYEEDKAGLQTKGIPAELAADVAWLDLAYSSLDIVEVARQTDCPVAQVAKVYFELGVTLDLHWLRERIRELPRHSHWQNQARAALRDEVYAELRAITGQLLRSTPGGLDSAERVAGWLEANRHGVDRCRALINDLKAAGRPDLAMLSVAVREIRTLGRDGVAAQ